MTEPAPGDHLPHVVGEAGLAREGPGGEEAERRLRVGLAEHRVAGQQRRDDVADGQEERVVPRGDHPDQALGLMGHAGANDAGSAGRRALRLGEVRRRVRAVVHGDGRQPEQLDRRRAPGTCRSPTARRRAPAPCRLSSRAARSAARCAHPLGQGTLGPGAPARSRARAAAAATSAALDCGTAGSGSPVNGSVADDGSRRTRRRAAAARRRTPGRRGAGALIGPPHARTRGPRWGAADPRAAADARAGRVLAPGGRTGGSGAPGRRPRAGRGSRGPARGMPPMVTKALIALTGRFGPATTADGARGRGGGQPLVA